MNTIQLRNSGADDNICEKIMPETYEYNEEVFETGNCDCDKCNGGCNNENEYFTVLDLGDYFIVGYYKKIGEVIIEKFSERIDKLSLKQL